MKYIIFLASLFTAASAMAESEVVWLPESSGQNYQAVSISPDGKLVTGYNAIRYSSETEYIGTNNGFIYNTVTEVPVDVVYDGLSGSSMSDVSNSGVAVGYAVESVSSDPMARPATYAVRLTDVVERLDSEQSVAYAVSDDGTVVAGTYIVNQVNQACIWRGGVRQMLPVPDAEEADEDKVYGSEAKFVNSDASVILGSILCESVNPEFGVTYRAELVTIWRLQDDGNYKYDLIYKDFYDQRADRSKPFIQAKPFGISNDGKWVSLQTRGWFQTPDGLWGMNLVDRMTRLNLETGKWETAELDGSNGMEYNIPCQPGGISNDGTIVGAYNPQNDRKAIVWKTDEAMPSLVGDEFSCNDISELALSMAIDITPDSKMIVGYGKDRYGLSHSFVIHTGWENQAGAGTLRSDGLDDGEITAFYTLDGKKVSHCNTEVLDKGIYIVINSQGSNREVRKIVIR